MNVLVACEYSGVVRDAFIKRGHNAMSCDILATEAPGPHYQGSILNILDLPFDLVIAHPPCTFLTCSAEWAYKDIQTKNIKQGTLIGAERRAARQQAIQFFMVLANMNVGKMAVENPVGVMSSIWRKPDQFIQPYEYGHDASKKTGLWLKGLPPLQPVEFIKPRYVCCGVVLTDIHGCPDCCGDNRPLPRWANQTDTGQNREPPSVERGKIRSATYQGWADAMAEQWG